MSKESTCQTDGVVFGMIISPKNITVDIELPEPIFWDGEEMEVLRVNIHNAMELVLSKYYYKKYNELD